MGRGKNDGHGEWKMIKYIYDEFVTSRSGTESSLSIPKFPDVCPICKIEIDTDERDFFNGPVYKCGGRYSFKPQIQKHTYKWWGHCPVKEEDARKERGRVCDGCGEKRLEGTGFPLDYFGWTCNGCGHNHLPTKNT